MTTTPSGKTLLDFGQNLVGRLRLTASGDSRTTLTVRRAEVLANGELCTRPLRHAAATDTYTLRGEGTEVFEPRFTFHGFRHAEITGQPDGFDPATGVRAVVLHSAPERTGSVRHRPHCPAATVRRPDLARARAVRRSPHRAASPAGSSERPSRKRTGWGCPRTG